METRRAINRSGLVLAAMLTLASACSDETGVMIKVSAEDALVEEIAALRFYVGEPLDEVEGYFADEDPLDDISLSNHDLAVSPYRLLIRPSADTGAGDSIAVAVFGIGEDGRRIAFGYLPQPVGFIQGSIAEWQVELRDASGPDFMDGGAFCAKWSDDEGVTHIGRAPDADCDGFTVDEGDCAPRDPAVSPGQPEICYNQVNDDCDDRTDGEAPSDALELCNGIDDNCDGRCDEGLDLDEDGYTECGSVVGAEEQCLPLDPSLVDCRPNNALVHPGVQEKADGKDNNCSGVCDDDPALDEDGDGFTAFGRANVCSEVEGPGDCNLDLGHIYPGAPEFCDGIDSDCDGSEITTTTCLQDVELTTNCIQGTASCSASGTIGQACNAVVSLAGVGVPYEANVCSAYDDCTDVGDPADPYQCLLGTPGLVPTFSETCTTYATSTELCPTGGPGGTTLVEIPSANTAPPCTMQIVGSKIQQGYEVSLKSNAALVPLVNSCSAKLAVAPTEVSSKARILITRIDSAGVLDVVELLLNHEIVEACQPGVGLSCNTWLVE